MFPDVVDGLRLQPATNLLRRDLVLLRERVDLGVNAFLLHGAVRLNATVVVAGRVQRHGGVAGVVGQRAPVDQALHRDRFVGRALAVIVEGEHEPLGVLDDGVGQQPDLVRLLLEVAVDHLHGVEAVRGRKRFAVEVFGIEEVVAFFGAAEEVRRAVLPAVGIDGEVCEVLAAAAVEGGNLFGQPGRGRLGNGLVPATPPSLCQAGNQTREKEGERNRVALHGELQKVDLSEVIAQLAQSSV